ncbi:MAG: hypothetical protein M1823_006342 [Watsoniomyces obsoletus]|nr:MAG: hypothetical protein M1823_006342 [Watsoniomyces obsoletus]
MVLPVRPTTPTQVGGYTLTSSEPSTAWGVPSVDGDRPMCLRCVRHIGQDLTMECVRRNRWQNCERCARAKGACIPVPRVFHREMLRLQADMGMISEMPEADQADILPQYQYRHNELMAAIDAFRARARRGLEDPTLTVRLHQQAVAAARIAANAARLAVREGPVVWDPIAGGIEDEELGVGADAIEAP